MALVKQNLRLLIATTLMAIILVTVQSKEIDEDEPVISCDSQACQMSCRMEGDKNGYCVNGCNAEGFCYGYCACPNTNIWRSRFGFIDILNCDDSGCAAYCKRLGLKLIGKCSPYRIDEKHLLLECNCES